MPKKAKKGGKKKKGGKRKGQGAAEKEELVKRMRNFTKAYQSRSRTETASSELPRILTSGQLVQDVLRCVEDERPYCRVVLDPDRLAPSRRGPKVTSKGFKKGQNPVNPEEAAAVHVTLSSLPPPPPGSLVLYPLCEAVAETKYNQLRCIHVWRIGLTDEDIVSLALFMETAFGSLLKVLELIGTAMSSWAVQRLSRALKHSQLACLVLDYNRLSAEDVTIVCGALMNVLTLQTLSLSGCYLTGSCGDPLGSLVATSQIRDLRLIGNFLQAKGAVEFIKPIVAVCEVNDEMPMLAKLQLQDNGIDSCGVEGAYAPVSCLREFKRWIACCKRIEYINLSNNLIGDSGASELLLALQQRKEGGHNAIRVHLTNRIQTQVLEAILTLTAAGGKKKGKKGKKKGKKKK